MEAPGGAGSKQQKTQKRDDQTETRCYQKRSCCTCFKDLSREQFCRCTRCKSFVQCLECSAYGYTKGSHLMTHPFIVCDPESYPVFVEDWTIEEEILLLGAIDSCGLGNWEEISQNLGTKTALECKVHYFSVYLESDTPPIPDVRVREPLELPPPLPFDTAPTQSCPSCGHERNTMFLNKKEKNTPAELIGYMPRRGEFDTEFNNRIETIVCGMSFSETDTEHELLEKLNRLECYSSQVVLRREKTAVVEEWELQYVRMEDWKNPLSTGAKPDLDLDNKILTFAPYIGRKDTELLAKRLHELATTIEKIEGRKNWQENGVTTCDEGFLFKSLNNLVRNGRIPDESFKEWNRLIKEYQKLHEKTETEDAKLLSPRELELCREEYIPPPIFTAIKDLLIREYVIRGGLSRDEALELCPDKRGAIGAMYELFLSLGWITK